MELVKTSEDNEKYVLRPVSLGR